MIGLVGYLVLFLLIGIGFIFMHLLAGKFIRPNRPDAEKATIYECGEPTIGSAWVQFDLRFYVVALLFVIFDVEVAFFFPWAAVFGHANQLRTENLPLEERVVLSREMMAGQPPEAGGVVDLYDKRAALLKAKLEPDADVGAIDAQVAKINEQLPAAVARQREVTQSYGWVAFFDILVFFGVLLVGFAYLWRRGDLQWVRALSAEERAQPPPPASANGTTQPAETKVLVGTGS